MSKIYKINIVTDSLVIKADSEEEALDYYRAYNDYGDEIIDPDNEKGILWQDGEFTIVKDITKLYNKRNQEWSLHNFATILTEEGN
jgi:hypothetical protein